MKGLKREPTWTTIGGLQRKGGSRKRRNHICTRNNISFNVKPFTWEGFDLPCYSQYDLLVPVLSILARALQGATRRNHHLALLVICAKFLILVNEDGGDLRTELADGLEDSHELKVLMDSASDCFQSLVHWDRSAQLAIYMVRLPKEYSLGTVSFIDVRN